MGTENHSVEIFNDYNNKQQCINFSIKNNSKSSKKISITNIDQNNLTFKTTPSSSAAETASASSSSHNKNIIIKRTNSEDVPNIPIIIDENNVIDGAKEILKVIRTDWNLNNVKFKFFTDGITNKLVGCFYNKSQLPLSKSSSSSLSSTSENESYNNSNNLVSSKNPNENDTINDDNTNDVVLIRVYGNNTELLIDRKAEQRNIRLLHTYGFAPSLFATFKNGLAYEYVPGCTLTPLTVIQPKIWTLIAQRMAEMHKVKSSETILNNSNNDDHTMINNGCCNNEIKFEPMLWSKTQLLLKLIPEQFSDKIKHERISKIFSSIATLRKEFEDLYKILEKLESPLVFSHNDLLLGNVIYNKNSNSVTFIDYEYAAINFQGFDIGNHFAEFTGIEVDEIDYSRYPTKEFQMNWLNVYLKHYLEINDYDDDNDDNNIILKNAINKLYVQSNQFALAAHLFWAIWGLVQAENSKIDFDFIKYSQIRYEEYLAKKDQFLSLKV